MATNAHEASARLFVDALGRSLPFKAGFTYKELHDFLRREGVFGLQQLSGDDLGRIASSIGEITAHQVTIDSGPTGTAERTPVSSVDLRLSANAGSPIQMLDHVVLSDGHELHVVAFKGRGFVGMDDQMQVRTFEASEVIESTNLASPLG